MFFSCLMALWSFLKNRVKFQSSQNMSYLGLLESRFNFMNFCFLRRAHPRSGSQVIEPSLSLSGGPHLYKYKNPTSILSLFSLVFHSSNDLNLQQHPLPLLLHFFLLKSSTNLLYMEIEGHHHLSLLLRTRWTPFSPQSVSGSPFLELNLLRQPS